MKAQKTISLLLFTSILIALSCSRTKPVLLKIEISPLDSISYNLTYNTGGQFFWEDSSSDLSTTIECRLTGSHIKNNPGKLNVITDSIFILSNILDSIEIFDTKKSIANGSFQLDFSDKNFSIDKIPDLPLSSSAEHQFARKLIKLTPTLPEIPIRVGFKWERERHFPLETSFGIAPCQIYRSYSFDSLNTKSSDAYISWIFRYNITESMIDSTISKKGIPMSGKGSGSAIIDIANNEIKTIEMKFSTNEMETAGMKVQWTEKALLVIEDRI
jgi:hypothetical protein